MYRIVPICQALDFLGSGLRGSLHFKALEALTQGTHAYIISEACISRLCIKVGSPQSSMGLNITCSCFTHSLCPPREYVFCRSACKAILDQFEVTIAEAKLWLACFQHFWLGELRFQLSASLVTWIKGINLSISSTPSSTFKERRPRKHDNNSPELS